MSKATYIAMDTETGGTDFLVNPILTAYFAVLDENLNILASLDLKIKPEEPSNKVEEAALRVNKIDLQAHLSDPNSLSRLQACDKFMGMLSSIKLEPKQKLLPLGHNVAFDVNFCSQFVPDFKWKKHIHYGVVCTFSIANFFKAAGLLPSSIGKLESLVAHYQIPKREAHTASGDVLMTIDVYAKMAKTVKDMTQNSSGLSIDLLSMLEK